jgi:hypothetical protein
MRQQYRFLLNFFSSDEGDVFTRDREPCSIPANSYAEPNCQSRYETSSNYCFSIGTEALAKSFSPMSFGLLQSFEMSLCASPRQGPSSPVREPTRQTGQPLGEKGRFTPGTDSQVNFAFWSANCFSNGAGSSDGSLASLA